MLFMFKLLLNNYYQLESDYFEWRAMNQHKKLMKSSHGLSERHVFNLHKLFRCNIVGSDTSILKLNSLVLRFSAYKVLLVFGHSSCSLFTPR